VKRPEQRDTPASTPRRPRFGWPVLVAGALVTWSIWRRPDVATALVVLGGCFTLIERWRPLRSQPSAMRRTGAATDAAGFIVDEDLAGLGLAAALVVALPLARVALPREIPRYLAMQPVWLRWAEAFVVSEVSGYWGHRLSHEVPALWRFHQVHHSSREMDWLAPNRRHPVDVTFARFSTSLPVLVLGFAAPAVVGYFAVKRIQGLLVHANISCRLGWLERVVATPFFHHWHHSAEPGTWNRNYAGSIPAVDWLFGTLYLPGRWPHAYGCDNPAPDVGYLARLASPWKAAPSERVQRSHAAGAPESVVAVRPCPAALRHEGLVRPGATPCSPRTR
jgi:sterol desaturase/sphingolipid hydroxylase (fatty acid hydroxylase superfamily)